jgi:hypothetical protein
MDIRARGGFFVGTPAENPQRQEISPRVRRNAPTDQSEEPVNRSNEASLLVYEQRRHISTG